MPAMATIKLEGATRTTEIVTTSNIDTSHDRIREFDRLAGDFFDAVTLQWFKVEPTANPNEWLLRFKHQDDRIWRHVLRIPDVGTTTIDFNPDFWEQADYMLHQTLRVHVIVMLAEDTVSKSACSQKSV